MFTGTNTTGVFGRMGLSPERQEEMENEASKYAVVEAVMKVYDENARLRVENERLKRLDEDIAFSASPTEGDPYAYAKARIMEAGREKLAHDAFRYWHDVAVRRNDDGSLSVERFEKWRKDNVDKVPDYMSREGFYKLMDAEIRAEYEKEKRKAMDALAEREDDGE